MSSSAATFTPHSALSPASSYMPGYRAGAGSDWAGLAPEWAADFRVIVPDLRGHGRSANPLSTFRHDEAAGDVVALLDHLGVGAFKGVGVSVGGNVLLHVATRYPERVS